MTGSRPISFLLICIIPFFYFNSVNPGDKEKLLYPVLVNQFYQQNEGRVFWFAPLAKELRRELINCIDSAASYDLVSQRYHYAQLLQHIESIPPDSSSLLQIDRIFTDAAIASMKDLSEGYKMSPWVGYDQVSPKYADSNNQFLLNRLSNCYTAPELKKLMAFLQPQEKEYELLKQELKIQKQNGNDQKARQLALSLNYFRWIHHFHFEKCIVVNIASAYLRYYEQDSMTLFMKVVVGKPSTPTPRFAAWCYQVILYPYWYVPRKIALNEYLGRLKRNPGLIDAMNMQVIDANGRVVDHYNLDWSSFNASYFPYTLRQSTGCDNALGVIKFNIASPYGVYLHDTNNKTAFFSGYRYYSHGCIRIEEAIDLGNHLLHNKLDTTFLQACYKYQKPVPVNLDQPVPVFVVYMPADASNTGTIRYYKDVYRILK
jgi:murein L,D-transpeptidase YcbB/YkuD